MGEMPKPAEFKTWQEIRGQQWNDVKCTSGSSIREKLVLRLNSAKERQPQEVTTLFRDSSEEPGKSGTKQGARSWTKNWVKTNAVSEIWINLTETQPDEYNMKIPDFLLTPEVPKTTSDLFACYQEAINKKQRENGHPFVSRNGYRIKPVVWERKVSLSKTLAKFEQQFEQEEEDPAQKNKMLKTMFKGYPGFLKVLEKALKISKNGLTAAHQHDTVILHLLDFEAMIMRAAFIAPQWPVNYDIRTWQRFETDSIDPNTIIDGLPQTDDNPAVVEIKTGKYCSDEETGTQKIRHESVGVIPPRNLTKTTCLITQQIDNSSAKCDNGQIREKLDALTTTEFWFRHFSELTVTVNLTIPEVLERMWFKLIIKPHEFTREYLKAYDIRQILLNNDPENPDLEPVMKRARRWYSTSKYLVGLVRLEVQDNCPQDTFVNLLQEVFLNRLDCDLNAIPPILGSNEIQGPSDVESFDGYTTTDSETSDEDISKQSSQAAQDSTEDDSEQISKNRPSNYRENRCFRQQELAVGATKVEQMIKDLKIADGKVRRNLELQLANASSSLKTKVCREKVTRKSHFDEKIVLSIGVVMKPWATVLKGPIVYAVATRVRRDSEGRCGFGIARSTIDLEAEEISLDSFAFDRNGEPQQFAISSSLAWPTIDRWVKRFEPNQVLFWGSMPWSNFLISRFQGLYPRVEFARGTQLPKNSCWNKVLELAEGAERLAFLMHRAGQEYSRNLGITFDAKYHQRREILAVLLQRVRDRAGGLRREWDSSETEPEPESDEERQLVAIQRVRLKLWEKDSKQGPREA